MSQFLRILYLAQHKHILLQCKFSMLIHHEVSFESHIYFDKLQIETLMTLPCSHATRLICLTNMVSVSSASAARTCVSSCSTTLHLLATWSMGPQGSLSGSPQLHCIWCPCLHSTRPGLESLVAGSPVLITHQLSPGESNMSQTCHKVKLYSCKFLHSCKSRKAYLNLLYRSQFCIFPTFIQIFGVCNL